MPAGSLPHTGRLSSRPEAVLFHLTGPRRREVSVISASGKRWNESMSGYWPSDTPRQDSFSGGRNPGDGK
jgi:hypothetical protein